jgi:hypothetical protein
MCCLMNRYILSRNVVSLRESRAEMERDFLIPKSASDNVNRVKNSDLTRSTLQNVGSNNFIKKAFRCQSLNQNTH